MAGTDFFAVSEIAVQVIADVSREPDTDITREIHAGKSLHLPKRNPAL